MKKLTNWIVTCGVLLSGAALAGEDFTLTSSAAVPNGKIPLVYTCDGKNISPPLSWHSAPATAKTFVLIVADPDAPAGIFYHWVLYNIPKSINNIATNSSPDGATIGVNSTHQPGYHGPCPPPGLSHRYIFKLYALDMKLALPIGANADTVMKAMANHVLKQTEYTMRFNR